MHPSFVHGITSFLVISLCATVGVRCFRVQSRRDNITSGYVYLKITSLQYPIGRGCYQLVLIGNVLVSAKRECIGTARVCMFTDTTRNVTKEQGRHVELCRPGNGFHSPLPSSAGEMNAAETPYLPLPLTADTSMILTGSLPFAGAFPETGWLNTVVSVGLVKLRHVAGTGVEEMVLRNVVGVVVSTRLSNTRTVGSIQRVTVPNTFCASSAVLRDDCEPFLSFEITWRIRCAFGYSLADRCGQYKKRLNRTKPQWARGPAIPQLYWTTNTSNKTIPGHTQLVLKSSSKVRRQKNITVALAVPLAILSVCLLVCIIGHIAARANKPPIRIARNLFRRLTNSMSKTFLRSDSFPSAQVGTVNERGCDYTPSNH